MDDKKLPVEHTLGYRRLRHIELSHELFAT